MRQQGEIRIEQSYLQQIRMTAERDTFPNLVAFPFLTLPFNAER
jgi:hypothetical protein